jgi:hypothetical protein
MLLGVDDFETIDSYHRGKMWLHSAWLHRQGTVWGLRVSLEEAQDEIRVTSGLALDCLGRELHLGSPACLDLGNWYAEHKDEPEVKEVVQENEDGTIGFDAHVAIRFKGCLARQVPALTEPCDSSGATTAYSRVIETVELLLRPGKAPVWQTLPGVLPYHRLRLLFGLEQAIRDDEDKVIPVDQEVLDVREDIHKLASGERPAAYLAAFRRFSALDEMDISPAVTDEENASSLFPEQDPSLLPLADIKGIILTPVEAGWDVTSGDVDNTVRPVHVPTTTIQELLCGPGCTCSSDTEEPVEDPGPETPVVGPKDADGPRIYPESVSIRDKIISFKVDSKLLKNSVGLEGLEVSSFATDKGWNREGLEKVKYDKDKLEVTVLLEAKPSGDTLRLIVRGTGPFPFMNWDKIPLAGAIDGPPGTEMNGNDFVFMIK